MIGHCISCGNKARLISVWDAVVSEWIWICAACNAAVKEHAT